MSHTPMCLWCDKQEIGTECPSELFCSDTCSDEWRAIPSLELNEDEDQDEDKDEDSRDW